MLQNMYSVDVYQRGDVWLASTDVPLGNFS